MVLMSPDPARRSGPCRAWQRLAIGAVAASLVGVTFAPPSLASGPRDQKKKVDQQITALKGDLDDTSAQLVRAYQALRQTQAQVRAARAELARAQSTLQQAEDHNAQVAAQLEVAQANEAKADDALARNRRQTQESKDLVGAIARQSYQQGGMGQLTMALEAIASHRNIGDQFAMVGTVLRVQNGVVRRLSAEKAQGIASQSHLQAVRHEVALLKAKAQAGVERAQAARAAASRAKQKVEALAASQRQHAAEVQKQKQAELDRLQRAKAESDRLERKLEAIAAARRAAAAKAAREARAAAARAAQLERERSAQAAAARAAADRAEAQARAARGVPRSSGFLSYPVNAPITSGFGMRFHPILHIWRLHAGVDFGAACGTPVHAAASGTVVSAGANIEAGQLVVIDHGIQGGTDVTTWYAHLSRILTYGGHVNRGDVIGYSGNFGLSTGCHLHFEVHEGSKPVNPLTWF